MRIEKVKEDQVKRKKIQSKSSVRSLYKQEDSIIRTLNTIYNSCQKLKLLRKPKIIAEEIINVLHDTMGFEGAILLVEQKTGTLFPFSLFRKGRSVDRTENIKQRIKLHNLAVGIGVTGYVARTGQSLCLGDVSKDSRYLMTRSGTRSELCVPLRVGNETIGVLNVESNKLNAYTDANRQLLEAIALQLAVSIQNAHLYEEAKKELHERKQAERALQESEEFNKSLLMNSPFPILVLNKDTSIRYVNPALEKLSGFNFNELSGMKIPYPWWEEKDVQDLNIGLKQIACNRADRIEESFRKRNGEKFWVEATYTSVKKGGRLKYCLVNWTDITAKRQIEQKLMERKKELEVKSQNLEEANVALKVLLKRRDEDKKELQEKILFNMKEMVEPYLTKLEMSGLDEKQKKFVEILDSNLKDILSPFTNILHSKHMNLTPTEIQVANFIKHGQSTKEIAELLNLSPQTIDFQRKMIRKKIGITNRKNNLRAYLLYMDTRDNLYPIYT